MTTLFQLICDDGELRLETFATEDERDARLRELIEAEFEAVFDTPIPPDADPWDCYEAIHEAGLWDHYYQLEDTVAPRELATDAEGSDDE